MGVGGSAESMVSDSGVVSSIKDSGVSFGLTLVDLRDAVGGSGSADVLVRRGSGDGVVGSVGGISVGSISIGSVDQGVSRGGFGFSFGFTLVETVVTAVSVSMGVTIVTSVVTAVTVSIGVTSVTVVTIVVGSGISFGFSFSFTLVESGGRF